MNELGSRDARAADARPLLDLERVASETALAHVFAGVPYPADDVLARWRTTLADEDVRVRVADEPAGDGAGGLAALVAWDAETVRHLAVRPDRWGTGLGRAALELAASEMAMPRLWVLADNERARRFYDHLGWSTTGAVRRAEWPPRPVEVELERPRVR